MTQNHPSTIYNSGFEAGLLAAQSLESHDIEIVQLARALSSLGKHAASYDDDNDAVHESCMECQTIILLSRVADYGKQLRAAEKRKRDQP